MSLVLSLANPDQALPLATLLTEAGQFKMSKGDTAWGPEPFTCEETLGMIATGHMYIAHLGDEVAGTTSLVWDDERIWGDRGLDQQAAYIHKLAASPQFHGQGIGAQIIAWVCDQACQAERPFVRLDCPYDNTDLCNYYEKLGFQEADRFDKLELQGVRNPNKYEHRVALYQKSL